MAKKTDNDKHDIFPFAVLGLSAVTKKTSDPASHFADIFQLSRVKYHRIYPVSLNDYQCTFILHKSVLFAPEKKKIRFELLGLDGAPLNTLEIDYTPVIRGGENELNSEKLAQRFSREQKEDSWIIGSAGLAEATISEPGKYPVKVIIDNDEQITGNIEFSYTKIPPFTQEQMNAIKSDPRLRTHKRDSLSNGFVIQGFRRETNDGSRLFLA